MVPTESCCEIASEERQRKHYLRQCLHLLLTLFVSTIFFKFYFIDKQCFNRQSYYVDLFVCLNVL